MEIILYILAYLIVWFAVSKLLVYELRSDSTVYELNEFKSTAIWVGLLWPITVPLILAIYAIDAISWLGRKIL